jgi:hypothetical protein
MSSNCAVIANRRPLSMTRQIWWLWRRVARALGLPLACLAHRKRNRSGIPGRRCAGARPPGHIDEVAGVLRQALEIFQRIGAAEAADVCAELDALTGARLAASGS